MLRLVVVLPLQPLPTGRGFPLATWPLHVTAAPTFVIETELAEVVSAIALVLADQPALSVSGAHDEGFGRAGRIPVTVLAESAGLMRLHRELVGALLAIGAVFDDPDFIGDGYRAHVTMTAVERIGPGEPLLLNQAAIVDMAPIGTARDRRVIWTAGFDEPGTGRL